MSCKSNSMTRKPFLRVLCRELKGPDDVSAGRRHHSVLRTELRRHATGFRRDATGFRRHATEFRRHAKEFATRETEFRGLRKEFQRTNDEASLATQQLRDASSNAMLNEKAPSTRRGLSCSRMSSLIQGTDDLLRSGGD